MSEVIACAQALEKSVVGRKEKGPWVSCSYSSIHDCIAGECGSLRFGIQVEQEMIKTWVEWNGWLMREGDNLGWSCCCHDNGMDAKAMKKSPIFNSLSLTFFLLYANLNDSSVDFLFPIFFPGWNFYGWIFLALCMAVYWVKNPLSFDLLLKSFTWWFNFFTGIGRRRRAECMLDGRRKAGSWWEYQRTHVMEGTERKELES